MLSRRKLVMGKRRKIVTAKANTIAAARAYVIATARENAIAGISLAARKKIPHGVEDKEGNVGDKGNEVPTVVVGKYAEITRKLSVAEKQAADLCNNVIERLKKMRKYILSNKNVHLYKKEEFQSVVRCAVKLGDVLISTRDLRGELSDQLAKNAEFFRANRARSTMSPMGDGSVLDGRKARSWKGMTDKGRASTFKKDGIMMLEMNAYQRVMPHATAPSSLVQVVKHESKGKKPSALLESVPMDRRNSTANTPAGGPVLATPSLERTKVKGPNKKPHVPRVKHPTGVNVTQEAEKRTCVEVAGLDAVTTKEEVASAIANELNIEVNAVLAVTMRPARYGCQTASVVLPDAEAKKLLQCRELTIGWSIVRIREKMRERKCTKCQKFGHAVKDCKSNINKRVVCFQCGLEGHKLVECQTGMRSTH